MEEDASSVCESRVEQRVASIMYRFASSSNLPLLPMGEIFKGVLYNVIQIRSLCANEPLNCIPLTRKCQPKPLFMYYIVTVSFDRNDKYR